MAGYGRAQAGIADLGGVAVAVTAGAAVAGVSVGDASLVFAGPGGSKRREPLDRCWNVRFEHVPPVRSFPSRPGQRHFPGLWWAATTCDHVGYESWLERDQVMALDFDPEAVAFSSQPFQLVFGASAGWAYRRVGALDPVFAANLRWLAGYRHRRCLRSDAAARICEVFAAPAA